MALELRSWINPQPYTTSYSTAPIAREAAYFGTTPEPVTVDPDHVRREAREYEDLGVGIVTLGGYAATPEKVELRSETLRLIRQSAAARDNSAVAV
ncbi:hypothetical protein [Rhodococcus sp. NPDC056516]|uniref:hypothetical protein n=1 Tax=Rhodococcus sp. NPDC056516 TaxID=3345847 RepID=UPI00366F0428